MQGPDPQQPASEGPAPQVVFEPVSKEMEALLRRWEAKTKNITSLSCPITRTEFDNIFATETRSSGMIYFENPDMGRIDFEPANKQRMAMDPGRQKQDGTAFKVLPGASTKWICTGKLIYILEMSHKTYDKIEIPPQMQGHNITRSPLPFIFGMKAQDAMDRFALRFGDFHNPDGDQVDKDGKPLRQVLHIVANPLDHNVAREYTQAEIILEPETFMPLNLRTIDPTQNKQTVYGFDNSKLKVGVNWGLKSPFRDPVLVGWEIMHDIKAEPEKPPVRQAQRNVR